MEALAPLVTLPVIPELGRSLCLGMGYQRIGDIPQGQQENFKRLVLEAQISKENEHQSFISDRSTIDCWVLWQRWNICTAMTYDSEAYYNMARGQGQDYSHIIYIPPMFAPQEDGFRWTDLDYQKIDRLVRMTLYEWVIPAQDFSLAKAKSWRTWRETMAWLGATGK